MNIAAFFKSSLRLATSLFLAALALGIAAGIASYAYDRWQRFQAREYETPKLWSSDVRSNLQFDLKAKTKLADGRMFIIATTDAHPAYMTYARKVKDAALVLSFLDKDGFKIYSTTLPLASFMTSVDDAGKANGLNFEESTSMEVSHYASFSKLQVEWNFDTDYSTEATKEPPATVQLLDHCAPRLAKAERLRRLAQYGEVREVGLGTYEAGDKRLAFFESDNSLLDCR